MIGTLIVAAAVPNFGTDQESLQAASAQDLRAHSARPGADRCAGGCGSAGCGGVLHDHQRVQSLACRTRGENLRPADAAMAGSGGFDVASRPASALLAAAIAGSFLPDLAGAAVGCVCRKPAHGLCNPRLCGPARDHARDEQPHRHARRASMRPRWCSAGRCWRWRFWASPTPILNIRSRVARKRGPPSLRT